MLVELLLLFYKSIFKQLKKPHTPEFHPLVQFPINAVFSGAPKDTLVKEKWYRNRSPWLWQNAK